jgi:hypothetical protein
MVQGLWEQARPLALERLDVLDDAVAADWGAMEREGFRPATPRARP